MHSSRAIIIGSGIAGMAAAIRLAVNGYEVTVYEKNSHAGGKLSLIEKDGFRFDAGPSLFTEPQELEALFAIAGERISDHITYKQVESACKYFFANGKTFTAWSEREKLLKAFTEQIEEPAANVAAYLDNAAQLYSSIGNIFLNNPLRTGSLLTTPSFYKALSKLRPYLLFDTLNEFHEKSFATGEAIQIFNRFATYNGSNPYAAPAMLCMTPHVELNEGVFYPEGGMISIARALYQLAVKKGVRFHFNTPVERIICAGDRIEGIVVNNENVFSDIVVSNADIYFTYRDLLCDERTAAKIALQEKSSSAIVFCWGMKKEFPSLQLHNIFFSGDYKAEFQHLFTGKTLFKDPTVYINITGKMENGHAPAGMENWFVMINVPSGITTNHDQLIAFARQQVLKKLRGTLKEDVEPYILSETILDPGWLEKNTGAYGGALYGISSNTKRSAFLRHPNFSPAVNGLYFCGGTVHPGGGIPLCLKGAKIVGEMAGKFNSRYALASGRH
jgi:phytoene desaturase